MNYIFIYKLLKIEQKSNMKLYILELIEGKYYVGKTNKSVEDRFIEHFKGTGSEWTSIYEPIKIIERIDNVDDFDEDKYTKIYMSKYGIDNVRGGSYVSFVLPDYQIKSLEHELKLSTNKCFKCGKMGHFINECQEVKNSFYKEHINNKNNNCFRCGRHGHYANGCYANTDIYGNNINDNTYGEYYNDSDESEYSKSSDE